MAEKGNKESDESIRTLLKYFRYISLKGKV